MSYDHHDDYEFDDYDNDCDDDDHGAVVVVVVDDDDCDDV